MTRTITFYEVKTDPDAYQYFLFADERALDGDRYTFDGRPKAKSWSPPAVFSYQPRLPEGDFWDLGLGGAGAAFAVRPEALERTRIGEYLRGVGELLPLPYRGREFAVANVTECIDALDPDASAWLYYDDGERYRVQKPVFRLDRLGGDLFKVPETGDFALYCYDVDGEEDQFKTCVETEGLTGLVFEPVYSVQR